MRRVSFLVFLSRPLPNPFPDAAFESEDEVQPAGLGGLGLEYLFDNVAGIVRERVLVSARSDNE